MSELTNANRIHREQARANEMVDLLRENPHLSYEEILSTLAKRWEKSADTVKHTFQYLQRKKIITRKSIWMVK